MSNRSLPELLRISFNTIIHNITRNTPIPQCGTLITYINNILINNINSVFYIFMAIKALPQIEIIEYLKNVWYSETIRIDDPGCYAKTPWYDARTSTLNVKDGIRDIIQWKYYMIIHDMIPRITEQHKTYFIELLDKYAALFDITYSKEPWNITYG